MSCIEGRSIIKPFNERLVEMGLYFPYISSSEDDIANDNNSLVDRDYEYSFSSSEI